MLVGEAVNQPWGWKSRLTLRGWVAGGKRGCSVLSHEVQINTPRDDFPGA